MEPSNQQPSASIQVLKAKDPASVLKEQKQAQLEPQSAPKPTKNGRTLARSINTLLLFWWILTLTQDATARPSVFDVIERLHGLGQ
ncbi:hypothetical protein PF005_g8245 [Phytophthora fragariae]|uniref:Uncharacterized protein n=2 Tax=Phytophthora TaxID=4783 RepID=A0A6A3YGF2_9STRA|nr:hypothetical protein PF003_g37791 [Phytophthora fragariae]KAE9039373.1 hypothetical protein PR002_g5541 [Phytophthora rubi]KAE8945043.1 hypothetical protein PF009_g5294 [Phytophthora fragariae]KAE9016284.1 hypothetical protein PF011_g7220 [Phytophthora fragariae]KAE9129418.1 hypothetical protein PF010_g4196 [Phytophthora fragariae]